MSLTPLSGDPAGGPVRNVRDPYAHRLQLGIDLSSGTGTSIPNFGLLNARNTLAAFGATLTKSEGATDHWKTESDATPYLDLSARTPPAAGKITLFKFTQSFPRGCIVMRFKITNGTDTQVPLFSSGADILTNGHLRIIRRNNANNNDLRIQTRQGGANRNIDFTPGTDFTESDFNVIRVEWGETNFRVWLNDLAVRDAGGTFADPVVTNVSDETAINFYSFGTQFGPCELSHFYWWDVPVDDHYWDQLRGDISLPMRPAPVNILHVPAGGVATRVTQTAVHIACVSDSGLSATTSVWVRAKYGTVASALSSTSPVATVTGPSKKLGIDITGLTAGTTYFYNVEYSTDNLNWFLARGGPGRFVTQRISSDTTFRFIIAADPHDVTAAGGPPAIEGSGYGTDIEFLV